MMNHRLLRCVLAGTAALTLLPSSAQPGPATSPVCEAPAHEGHPLLGRKERITQYEALGEQCLKRLVVDCDAVAGRQLLDSGSAISCSIGYEALLKRGFRGDFQAMLAWWRSRDAEPEAN